MSMISINPFTRNDPFYRYKMPPLSSKITDRGNGTFTTLNNLDTIAEAIHHPFEIIFKFIGYDLGTNVNMKNNTIKGAHKNDDLQTCIDTYINEFVLCPKCLIPELTLTIEGKKKKIKCKYSCSACGATDYIIKKNKIYDKTLQLIKKDLSNGNIWKKHTTAKLEIDLFDTF